jgi:hypothetical protein
LEWLCQQDAARLFRTADFSDARKLMPACPRIALVRAPAARLRSAIVAALNEERTQLLRAMMALSRAQANESRTIAMLCTRLKLTQLYDSTSLHKARRAFLTEQKPVHGKLSRRTHFSRGKHSRIVQHRYASTPLNSTPIGRARWLASPPKTGTSRAT